MVELRKICCSCSQQYGSEMVEVPSDSRIVELSNKYGYLASHGYCKACYNEAMIKLNNHKVT
jgi:hypothetical protein